LSLMERNLWTEKLGSVHPKILFAGHVELTIILQENAQKQAVVVVQVGEGVVDKVVGSILVQVQKAVVEEAEDPHALNVEKKATCPVNAPMVVEGAEDPHALSVVKKATCLVNAPMVVEEAEDPHALSVVKKATCRVNAPMVVEEAEDPHALNVAKKATCLVNAPMVVEIAEDPHALNVEKKGTFLVNVRMAELVVVEAVVEVLDVEVQEDKDTESKSLL